MTIATSLMLPQLDTRVDSTRWFSPYGCVVTRGNGVRDVLVGGTLVGSFDHSHSGVRNLLLIELASNPGMHLEHLAAAFEITTETLRLLRRAYDKGGAAALWERRWGGSHPKVTPAGRARIEGMFEQGLSTAQIVGKLRGRARVSVRTIERARVAWRAARVAASASTVDTPTSTDAQLSFAQMTPATVAEAPQSRVAQESDVDTDGLLRSTSPTSAPVVQHAGALVMVAMLESMGLYARAAHFAEGRVGAEQLRIALDAVVIALSLGEGTVEGVRRVGTPSATTLLRATRAPSASWVRRALGRFAVDLGGARLHLAMARAYIQEVSAQRQGGPVVFYVDNHLRPYTGQHVIRKGWRMQDKRVLPGCTDYYVHDVDGRPVLREQVPHHGSLTDHLCPLARIVRNALGEDERVMFAFDRAGSFPEQMAALRDEGVEFVTYERRPYPLLAASDFGEPVMLDDEPVQIAEAPQRNLRGGRGRVRRIAVRRADGSQLNLLAISKQDAEFVVRVMAGRWKQENAFKHGVERWGINHLDGRTVAPYPPGTIVPNPARRRLDHALRLARAREGEALRRLAHLPADHVSRDDLERDLAQAIKQQADLEAQRPRVPAHAPLEQTELAGQLVRHESEYKTAIDAVRIACANAEADLAADLAPALRRPREAKKLLANLFAAPGRVRVGADHITLTLLPATNTIEAEALDDLFAKLDARNLVLPGDPRQRVLRFRHQT